MTIKRAKKTQFMFTMALLVTGSSLNGAVPVAEKYEFQCEVALMTSQQQFTNSTPVSVSFVVIGKSIQDIHVIDAGGILYPGGNMKMVQTSEAIRLETVSFSKERPGQWSGKIEKNFYRLKLNSNGLSAAVEIGLGRKPVARTSRFGLIWNATHQPEGMPKPISGNGTGNCALKAGVQQ